MVPSRSERPGRSLGEVEGLRLGQVRAGCRACAGSWLVVPLDGDPLAGVAWAEGGEPMTDHARRVATTLNRFVGMLHAARCTAALWILHAEDPRYRFAAKYGLQMTFGTAMLTLRKFQDLSTSGQFATLLPEGTEAHKFSEWVLRECEQHKTRDAANLLFAHYAPYKTDPPLSDREIRALVENGGWTTEEEIVEWIAPIIEKLRLIRDEMMSRYGITAFEEDEVTG